MRPLFLSIALLVCASPAFAAPADGAYEDPNVIQVLNDKFSETDLQLIANRMASSLVESADRLDREDGRKARLVVGRIKNATAEKIDTDSLADRIQVALFKSGKFELLDKGARLAIAEEYEYQQSGSVEPGAIKGPGHQYGADVILVGSLASIAHQDGADRSVYYKMSMTASDLSSSVVQWAEDKGIRKKVELSGISSSTSRKLKTAGYVTAVSSFLVGSGVLIAGLAQARDASFHFEYRTCTDAFGTRPDCMTAVDDPARGPNTTLTTVGGAMMIAAPAIGILTYALVPDGNPALDRLSIAPNPGGATVAFTTGF